jgi:hypothetical protein
MIVFMPSLMSLCELKYFWSLCLPFDINNRRRNRLRRYNPRPHPPNRIRVEIP